MSTYTPRFPDPLWVEKDRQKPISTIPYVGQHNTFRCECCRKDVNRKLRKRDGKRNLCQLCFDKVPA